VALVAAGAAAALVGGALVATSGLVVRSPIGSPPRGEDEIRLLRSSADPASLSDQPPDFFADSEWCLPPQSTPLNYAAFCPTKRDTVYKYGVFGGLTNALGFLLKGALHAAEDRTCFVVDQTGPGKYAPMATREAPEDNVKNFLGRYFEPIGLPWGGDSSPEGMERHPIAESAKRVQFVPYPQINNIEAERLAKARETNDGKRSVESMGWIDNDNVTLKKRMLRRVWRLLPNKRNKVCKRLLKHDVKGEYMAMSVRRGEKKLEYNGASESVTMESYIEAAEKAVNSHFNGVVPKIFVATDYCSAIDKLRSLRPKWTFVSECDRGENENDSGFILSDMVHWTPEQTDAHYEKFFAELIGMASAKYWIGVSSTNVSPWVYFMRGFDKENDSWHFINDTEGTVDYM